MDMYHYWIRDDGAAEGRARRASPSVLHPCFDGTDVDSAEQLIDCQFRRKDRLEMRLSDRKKEVQRW